MSLGELAGAVTPLIPFTPAMMFTVLGALWLFDRAPDERATSRAVLASLLVSLAGALVVAADVIARGGAGREVHVGQGFAAGEYGFELVFLLDGLSATMVVLTAVISLLVGRFAVNYLHREAGFFRFYLLLALFSSGFQLMVMGGTYDLLFTGWEIVGLTSVLLIGFFHERAAPNRAAMRAFITYRLCDIGLLIAMVLVHQEGHGTHYLEMFAHRWSVGMATVVGQLLLLAAAGKSALFPFGSWLPRAMEGPTPSSALFYAALSVHGGVYLLLRSAPIILQSPVASATVAAAGALTALHATVVWRAQTDVKSALAYATSTQVGLILIETGLGWTRLATLHLVAHAVLRCYQMLRAPSAPRDASTLRDEFGGGVVPDVHWVRALMPPRVERWWYRAALERFYLDTTADRMIVEPVLRLGVWIDRFERRWVGTLSGWTLRARGVEVTVREEGDHHRGATSSHGVSP